MMNLRKHVRRRDSPRGASDVSLGSSSVCARVSVPGGKAKVDVQISPNQLLIFGRGKGGPYIIKEAPLAALDIPFKAVAWEDSKGKVWLSYTNGTCINHRYAIGGATAAAKDIDATTEKIAAEALK